MHLRANILSLLIFVMILGSADIGQSKSYTIPVIRVEVSVQPDGTIRITEHRTYVFDGSFSWADYRLPFDAAAGFTALKNIQIAEKGTAFINRNTEKPGTFMVQRSDGEIRVQWFYQAEDERRSFTISYTLEGALTIGPEWSQFFWNYVRDNREKDTDSLYISMELPYTVSTDSLYTWKHGPQENITLQHAATGYTVTATNIDNDDYVKIRSVFPRSVFNQQQISTNNQDFTLEFAQNDEKAYQARLKRETRYAGYGQKLALAVVLLSLLAFVLIYQKYGKRHSARGVSSTETIMIPSRLEPAVAGWLLQGRSIHSGHLMATLLDLARRKYFTLTEQEPEEQWLSGEKRIFTIEKNEAAGHDTLSDWESSVAEFVTEQIDEGNDRLDKLFSESSYSASKWFSKWKKKLKQYCTVKGWYDEKSYQGVYINIGVQLFFVAWAVLATIWAGPMGIVAIFITALLMIFSVFIIRRTPKGEQVYARWKAYKKGLKNAKHYTIQNEVLDKHFIYAIAFGLSKQNIETIFEQCGDSSVAFYWFVFYGGDSAHSAGSVAATFSTLGATGPSAFPGATAGGAAGASAGAAGGGAAGGAG